MAKLLENIVAQSAPNQANEFLKYATTAVSLQYLSSFWELFYMQMPLIN